jgi:hypothetical protein
VEPADTQQGQLESRLFVMFDDEYNGNERWQYLKEMVARKA